VIEPMSPRRALLLGAAAVGVLDILDAFVFFGFRGVPPLRILQAIASGLVGPAAAVAGGLTTAALGLLLHFFIAFMIVLVFYLVSRKVPILTRHPVILGALYGIAVYFIMTLVVVPSSAIAAVRALPSTPVLVNGLLIHAFGVGIPAALFSRAARPVQVAQVG
jgi:hypothetical protein